MTLVGEDLPELSEDVPLLAKHQMWLLLLDMNPDGTDARGVWIESRLVIGVTHVTCLGHLELGLDLGLIFKIAQLHVIPVKGLGELLNCIVVWSSFDIEDDVHDTKLACLI